MLETFSTYRFMLYHPVVNRMRLEVVVLDQWSMAWGDSIGMIWSIMLVNPSHYGISWNKKKSQINSVPVCMENERKRNVFFPNFILKISMSLV